MNDNVTLLLVDDLEENLFAMAALLRGPAVRVLKARSGEEALELLLVNEVALALVDVQMPGMDGFELAELMRGSERTKQVPIVFVTAGAHDRKRMFRGYDSGAVDFLYKPIEPHILTNKVNVFVELFRQKQALARVSTLQRAIFDSANFSSIATDANGVIQIFNVGAERMLGYTAAEVMNKITPADISDPQEVIARAKALSVELGTPITPGFEALVFKASRGIEDIYELTYIRKDGSRFPAVVSVTALRDAQEAIIGYLLIGSDNTARKQASQYARSLLEASLDPLVTISAEGKITDVNEGSIKVTGVAREKLIGTDFSDYFTEPKQAREGYQQVFAKGFVTDYPLTIRHKDGRLTDVLYNASIYKDVSGNVLGVFAAARDITARKQASQYARSLLEASLDPLVTISAEGKITDVNEGSIKATGVAREKLIGTDFSNYFTEPEQAREGYQQVFAKGFVTDYPLTIRHKNGRLIDVLYNASVYKDAGGNVLGVFAAARDITARKQVEEGLREAQQQLAGHAEKLEKTVSDRTALLRETIEQLEEFSYSVAHDLRAPLRAMQGYAKAVLKDYGDQIGEEGKDYLQRISRAGLRMDALTRDVLTYSKVARASMPRESVLLDKLVPEIIQHYPQIQAAQAEITVASPLLPVLGNEIWLTQAISNLLGNAVKFVPEGTTPQVRVRSESRDGNVRLWIEDNGIGIKPEYQSRLFGMFERVHLNEKYEGTGIGLAIVRKSIERMGGTVGLESDGETGSKFWIQLPAPPENLSSNEMTL